MLLENREKLERTEIAEAYIPFHTELILRETYRPYDLTASRPTECFTRITQPVRRQGGDRHHPAICRMQPRISLQRDLGMIALCS